MANEIRINNTITSAADITMVPGATGEAGATGPAGSLTSTPISGQHEITNIVMTADKELLITYKDVPEA